MPSKAVRDGASGGPSGDSRPLPVAAGFSLDHGEPCPIFVDLSPQQDVVTFISPAALEGMWDFTASVWVRVDERADFRKPGSYLPVPSGPEHYHYSVKMRIEALRNESLGATKLDAMFTMEGQTWRNAIVITDQYEQAREIAYIRDLPLEEQGYALYNRFFQQWVSDEVAKKIGDVNTVQMHVLEIESRNAEEIVRLKEEWRQFQEARGLPTGRDETLARMLAEVMVEKPP